MRLGLDYGGTKIEGIVLGPGGEARARARVATPRHDYAGGIRAIHDLMARLEAEAGGPVDRVGIGVPGSVDRASGRVTLGNATWLHGRDLRGDLAAALERPVRIANDANCFALSEAIDGAGAGAAVVFGAILGTGIGGGLVVHGRLIEGANAIAGEWGHVPLPEPLDDERPGPPCSCGRPGHVESWLSGPNLAADHARRLGTAEAPAVPAIVAAAEAGDALAAETLARFEDRLARALAAVVNILDPDVIVLGGGLSNIARIYAHVPALMAPRVFGTRFNTRLVRNRHGDSSGVRGAAWL